MHDLKFARQIIAALEETLKKWPVAKPVISLTAHVSLSPFSHVGAQRLKETFELLAEAEGFPPVRLSVKIREIEIFCQHCRGRSKVVQPAVICPRCRSEDIRVFLKEEFVVDAIEIETSPASSQEKEAR
ncbi:MAG: hydrogenase/urease maturation nickel metallochaperone HypA [Candidatus Omnitrophota bacterium]|jgi:Zn finger protein HypA/HybF involved in hydrogenase expression